MARTLLTLALRLIIGLTVGQGVAHAQSPDDVQQMVRDAAVTYGANPQVLLAIVRCETGGRFNADAVGDRGHSHGIAQLSDLSTGLLGHFHSVGYTSAYNAAEAADYLGRVGAGQYAGQGITLSRWTCSR